MKILRIPLVIILLVLAGRVTAQTFTNLHSFTAFNTNGDNSDGASPDSILILSGNTMYGTAGSGGTNGNGTVFAVNTNGTGFTTLHDFTSLDGIPKGVVLSGNTLYGVTVNGGTNGNGTVFAVKTNGTGFATLYPFSATDANGNNGDGVSPSGGLILSGNTLYGTAGQGGTNGDGTVFAIKTNGTGFTTLYTFSAIDDNGNNSDGSYPDPLILSGSILYSATQFGGMSGAGTLFSISTNGMHFASYSFTADYFNALCEGPLIISGNTLYGTFDLGGTNGSGNIFAISTNETGFTSLYSFSATDDNGNNNDGVVPGISIVLSNMLYGFAVQGGTNGNGTIFAVKTNGMGFATLYTFSATDDNGNNGDGANPVHDLTLSGTTLYGPAEAGGSSGNGTLFSLTLGSVSAPLPQLTIIRSGLNVILTWPTNASGFALESTTNLVSPAMWNTNSPAPVVVNGQNAVTNAITVPREFFRLFLSQ